MAARSRPRSRPSGSAGRGLSLPHRQKKRPQPAHFPAQSKEEERVRTECLSVPTPARPPSLKTLPSGNKHFVQGATGENWSDGCCTSLSTSTLRGGDVTGAQNLGGASPTTCGAEARPSGRGGAGFKSTASQEQLQREHHTLSPKGRTTSPRLDPLPNQRLCADPAPRKKSRLLARHHTAWLPGGRLPCLLRRPSEAPLVPLSDAVAAGHRHGRCIRYRLHASASPMACGPRPSQWTNSSTHGLLPLEN